MIGQGNRAAALMPGSFNGAYIAKSPMNSPPVDEKANALLQNAYVLPDLHMWEDLNLSNVPRSIAILVLFGIIGIGRPGPMLFSQIALYAIYAAGLCWWAGEKPYDPEQLSYWRQTIPFPTADLAYLPQMAPICLMISSFSPVSAALVMICLNVVCVAMLAVISIAWPEIHPVVRVQGGISSSAKWYLAAIIIGNPFTTHVVWMGQWSLLASTLLLSAVYLIDHQRSWLGEGLLGLASFKPQPTILPVIWILLRDRIGSTTISLVCFGVAALLVPVLWTGSLDSLLEWYPALQRLLLNPNKLVGNENVFGLSSLGLSLGL